jgi:hypothetical protein
MIEDLTDFRRLGGYILSYDNLTLAVMPTRGYKQDICEVSIARCNPEDLYCVGVGALLAVERWYACQHVMMTRGEIRKMAPYATIVRF